MVPLYQGVPGIRVEDLGTAWAAYSPASGETHLINDESAVLVEWLVASGPANAKQVAEALSDQVGIPVVDLLPRVELGWHALLTAGLIRLVVGGYPHRP